MDAVKADLRRALATLDRLGHGGSAVAIHVSAAIAATENRKDRADFSSLVDLERVLWPCEHNNKS